MIYQRIIREELEAHAATCRSSTCSALEIDPRHIEGLMRLEYGTLDHLTREDFTRWTEVGILTLSVMGKEEAEELAQSYGL